MIRIIACGKLRDKWLKDGIAEFEKRIRPYDRIELIEVVDEKAPESNSAAENEQVKRIEGQRLLSHVKDNDYMILLDLAGKPMDSVALSKRIDQCRISGKPVIDFVIGGSLGVSEDLIRRADIRWKLSDNTFPHGLCRVLVIEQIYRSFRILNHEPYHK
ncbi:MAG: 23S rRNA (pseudouridine(1915)-N(3))-methyltransferase RlmH [Solobacterium sp.]|nr:23S rRNA (pseudouridine(1915)-N(3))-methyltransferase RlmH [Solobacterium sp.]